MSAAVMSAQFDTRPSLERLNVEDFETASIRSAAPSYVSEAPSYHSVAPNTEFPPPPYSPPPPNTSSSSAMASNHPRANSVPSNLSGNRTQGLPPVPTGPLRRNSAGVPTLSEFRIPSWSTISANPTARHYHSVAHRRVMAANDAAGHLRRMVLDRVDEEVRNATSNSSRVRALEDPYLVGDEAATRARAERLARENLDEVLIREDRRWDWFHAQAKDWEHREQSWNAFRRGVENRSRGRLARRIWAR